MCQAVPYSFVDMTLYFFIYSFCGWLMETILCSIDEKRFVNRGFLNGPICPIYGCGLLLIFIFLLPVRDNIDNVFVAAVIIYMSSLSMATLVEYLVSWIMEKLFKARWWDYSRYKLNINGRVTLEISLIWGALSTAVIYLVHPRFENLVKKLYSLGDNVPYIIAVVLLSLMAVDLIISTLVALKIGEKIEQLEKLAVLIRGYVESLSLPTREDILKKIESLYELVSKKHEKNVSGEKESPDPELHKLAFEALKSRIASLVQDLKEKRESIMAGTRFLQRRMLKAFPYMKSKGTSLDDWKKHLKSEKGENAEKSKTD
ncbi:MAG TPA: putative ABC transporter permease [Clostridiales bacterium]|nr:putative ABC transporter permease [Clostridiales bacterium]